VLGLPGCNNMVGPTVTIAITQDMVCASSNGADVGFSFQLNAYSPKGSSTGWQQYSIALIGNQLSATVDNWTDGPGSTSISGTPIWQPIATLQEARLPAGYQLNISLVTDDNDNVYQAVFTVTDGSEGPQVGSSPVSLTLESLGVAATDLAPIVAFQLNLVGPHSSQHVLLSSGAGLITYAMGGDSISSTPWATTGVYSECTQSPNTVTAEEANSYYGELPSGPDDILTQSFGISITPPGLPAI
jgi:hypothetical protein